MINLKNILTRLLKIRSQFVSACKNVQLFQERAWIVSIERKGSEAGTLLKDTFVVSEDDFSSPMSWMHKRHYSQQAIDQVDNMRRSQVLIVNVAGLPHHLMRVK